MWRRTTSLARAAGLARRPPPACFDRAIAARRGGAWPTSTGPSGPRCLSIAGGFTCSARKKPMEISSFAAPTMAAEYGPSRKTSTPGCCWSIDATRRAVPVVEHDGGVWRAVEFKLTTLNIWGDFAAGVISAPADADLLQAKNWRPSNRLPFTLMQLGKKGTGPICRNGPEGASHKLDLSPFSLCTWLEGNIVVAPDGGLVNILRMRSPDAATAAVIHVSRDGRTLSFDPKSGLIAFPGGSCKFTIRYDPRSKRYWSLVNVQKPPQLHRNVLALTSSPDLKTWKVESIVLRHPDSTHHAFQYADWLFDGDDLIAVSRTGWDNSHRADDANYFTFHRIKDFRAIGDKERGKKTE